MRKAILSDFAWPLVCTCLCVIYALIALIWGNTGQIFSGVFVTDGITLFRSAIADAGMSLSEVLESYQSAAGLALLNAMFVGASGLLPMAVNFILLVTLFGSLRRFGYEWPLVMFISVPFYLASYLLPSKDIIVAALSTCAIILFFSGKRLKVFIALTISVAVFFIRDGFGVILTVSFLYVLMIRQLGVSPAVAMFSALFAAASFWLIFDRLLEGSFLYARAFSVAEQGSFYDAASSPSATSYLLRLFANTTNLAFRSAIFDTSLNVHLVALAYWISGLTLMLAAACCFIGVFWGNKSDQLIGLLGGLLFALVSIAPYVQPRYLLPVCFLIPMFSFSSRLFGLRSYAAIAAISVFASVVYASVGNYPPAPSEVQFEFSDIVLP